MKKFELNSDILNISLAEKKVLIAIYKFGEEHSAYAPTDEIAKKTKFKATYLNNILVSLKKKRMILTPVDRVRGVYELSSLSIKWLNKNRKKNNK